MTARTGAVALALLTLALLTLAACSGKQATTPITTSAPIRTTSSIAPTTTTTIAAAPTSTTRAKNPNPRHAYPIAPEVNSSYQRTHGEYPATDVFAACGTIVRAMADGEVIEARSKNLYDRKVDNPALRGGPSVAVLGDDGVRYYTSHLDDVRVKAGDLVQAGDPLGVIALTGDSDACHTHVGISATCPGPEWSVRRGVVWPWPYLDAWRKGDEKLSPAPEILNWLAKNPDACARALADPNARDAAEPTE
jgi:peptidoglycan LD-endopeptidase LytH